MNKLLINICCWFIPKKKNKRHFKEKHGNDNKENREKPEDRLEWYNSLFRVLKLLKINNSDEYTLLLQMMQNTFKQRLQALKERKDIVIPDIDYMNSAIFSFSGGLADNIRQLFAAMGVIKCLEKKNVKIYFNVEYVDRYEDFILEKYYNISKYINYELIEIPEELLKAYNDSGLYNYSYKNYKYNLMKNSNIFLNTLLADTELIRPPFIYKMLFNREFIGIEKYLGMLKIFVSLNEANSNKLKQIKEAENSVCVHVRMGDILKPDSVNFLPKISYFKNSINKIIQKLGKKQNITFYIFSNSISLVKARLNNKTLKVPSNITIDYVDINKESEPCFELELMRNCQHFILSLGSFSLLAAKLGQCNDKIVIEAGAGDLCGNKIIGGIHNREREWGYRWKGRNVKEDWDSRATMDDITILDNWDYKGK
ncbi:MAG: alpha-1,2-fucosyltransferase [Rickettsiales bacterium]|jgi:hypothetical protein|nr:alpha-1,2-fucosyltransferase [Rickettsiales bacterium]